MKSLIHMEWRKYFRERCGCCCPKKKSDQNETMSPDDDSGEVIPNVSNNGFTKAMADKYMEAVMETIDFAEKDSILKHLLKKEITRVTNNAQPPVTTQQQANGDIGARLAIHNAEGEEQKVGDH